MRDTSVVLKNNLRANCFSRFQSVNRCELATKPIVENFRNYLERHQNLQLHKKQIIRIT